MKGVKQDFPSFDFMNRIGKDSLLCDLIYSPARTSFLIEGEKERTSHFGQDSYAHRTGLEADRLYLGVEIMREKAYKRIIDNLTGKVEGI